MAAINAVFNVMERTRSLVSGELKAITEGLSH
jgi:hypothetical protein